MTLRDEMMAAAHALAADYDEVAHVAADPAGGPLQRCSICGHVLHRDGPPWFATGEVVFQSIRRATGRTAGHAAAGPGRPLITRETFELWSGERWCDVTDEEEATAGVN